MKKILYILFFSLFLFIPGIVNAASDNMMIDFDSHDKFNYFYEQKNSTPFYHFLVSQGSDLPKTLNDYYQNGYSSTNFNLRIFYPSELDFTNYNYTIPENTSYVIVADKFVGNPNLNYDGKTFTFCQKDTYKYYFGLNDDAIFYFFDSNSNYLGFYVPDFKINSSDNYVGRDILLDYNFDVSKLNSPGFSYFISKYYYFNNSSLIWNYNTDIIVSDLLLDGKQYLIDDNDNYNSFISALRKIFSFGDIKYYDVSDSSLNYFRENFVYTYSNNLLSLYHMLVILESSDIPFDDDFLSVKLYTPSSGSYYFVPKVNDNSFDYNLYFYTPYDNMELNVLIYDISTDKPLLLDDYIFVNPLKNVYGRIGFDSLLLGDGNSPFKVSSNYMYYISTNTNKYPIYIYYNKNVYDVFRSDFSFINPNTGNSIDFDSSRGKFDFNYISDTLNSNDNNLSFDNLDLSSSGIFNTITDFVKNFLPAITSIFTLVFLCFSSLPVEVQNLFYFLLVAGIIILIFKLIKG